MKNETTEVMIGFDVTRTIERITIDDDSEIDREKLFTLINKRGADDCWNSELDRYLNSTRFCGLEIEYR